MTHTEESLMALALSIQEGNGGMSALRLAIREVLAECERLRKDAERYRWLRDYPFYRGPVMSFDGLNLKSGADLDAAIDAALKEQP